jgi:hypothetical protein
MANLSLILCLLEHYPVCVRPQSSGEPALNFCPENNLTKSLGTQFGVRANAIAPGLVNPAMGAHVPQAAKGSAKT